MKKFALLFAMVIMSSMAQATEVLVFDMAATNSWRDLDASLSFERSTGKVFVNLEVANNNRRGESTHRPKHFKAEVAELRFDASTSSILLSHEGQEIECATVTPGRVFNWDVIRSTGCQLFARTATRIEYGRRASYYEVVLKIK